MYVSAGAAGRDESGDCDAADERRGLKWLLRYCVRSLFAYERLTWAGEHHDRLIHRLPGPMPDGHITLYMASRGLFDPLARLIPPLCRHHPHYPGVFPSNLRWAPNAIDNRRLTARPVRVAAVKKAAASPSHSHTTPKSTAPGRASRPEIM